MPAVSDSSVPSAYGAAVGALATSVVVLVVGLGFAAPTAPTHRSLFESRTVLGSNHTQTCLTFAGRLNCWSYNVTIPGPSGASRVLAVNASLNRSCPTTCYVELLSRAADTTLPVIRVMLDPAGVATGILPTGAGYLLMVETWGCSAFAPCPPPPVIVSVAITDMGQPP